MDTIWNLIQKYSTIEHRTNLIAFDYRTYFENPDPTFTGWSVYHIREEFER